MRNADIIRTKLYPPPTPRDHVPRSRLVEDLDRTWHNSIILISAPAGYGKSILISEWLATLDSPGGWLSLDEHDNDLRQFLNYFLAAIQNMFPAVGRKTQSMVNAVNMPPFSKLASSLINELSGIKEPFVLTLDDYHYIREQSVHDLLTELLRYQPQSIHLVIISRKAIPLPVSTYRAQGRLIEIDAAELLFTIQETETFLRQSLSIEVDTATATAWQEKTEGWVTGLLLAVIRMRQGGVDDDLMRLPEKDSQFAKEYFFKEVYSLQPGEMQDCLLKTAILDRFNAPLCEAVCGLNKGIHTNGRGGWGFIEWLKKENLFLIPLDAENDWFRYHHLFQKLLLSKLRRHHSAKDICRYHRRASKLFTEKGLIEEALEHSLASGDTKRVVGIVAKEGFKLMENQEWARLQRWLHMLPSEEIDQSPELLMLKAWIFQVQHNRLDTFVCLEKVENLKVTSQSEILARFDSVKGYYETLNAFRFYMAANGQQALAHARIAIDNLSIQQQRAVVLAHITALGSHQMLDDLETGLYIYKDAIKEPAIKEGDYYSMFVAYICFAYWMDADLLSFQQTAEAAVSLVEKKYLPENAAFANYFRGIAHYCLNELDRAEERLLKVVHTNVVHNSMIFAHSSFALALIYQAKGDPDKAREYCDAVTAHANEISNDVIARLAHAFTAELELCMGRIAESSRWSKLFRSKPFVPPYLFYMPQLTQIKILLAQDTEESRQQAADLLDELHAFLLSINNKVFLIQVLAQQALLHDARGDVKASLDTLREAISLAEPGGFIRLFVDMGPRMADLLKRLVRQNKSLEYIGRIIAAFREEETGMLQGVSDVQTVHLSSLNTQPLVDPLTSRELEIMKLLMKRLRNKEIADKLIISSETVKSHLTNIYQKLDVNTRQQAVDKVTTLGIFSGR